MNKERAIEILKHIKSSNLRNIEMSIKMFPENKNCKFVREKHENEAIDIAICCIEQTQKLDKVIGEFEYNDGQVVEPYVRSDEND